MSLYYTHLIIKILRASLIQSKLWFLMFGSPMSIVEGSHLAGLVLHKIVQLRITKLTAVDVESVQISVHLIQLCVKITDLMPLQLFQNHVC